jgi:NifU-like protein involved in Fe-S cluster formation
VSNDTDLASVYSRRLRELAAKVRADKRLVSAKMSVTRSSRSCGSSVTLDICRDGDTITALGWRTRACTLGMAATAIVIDQAQGRRFCDVVAVAERLRLLLAGGDEEIPPPWNDLMVFSAARDLTARHGSIMLPFEALIHAS